MDLPTLEKKIRKYRNLYFNEKAAIEDEEYDLLIQHLKRLDPDHPLLTELGEDASGNFPKVGHLMPMGSQQKAMNLEEMAKWWKKGHAGKGAYLVQYKLDGLSLELQYERGKLTRGVTRGDGKKGDDITSNVRKMRGVPFTLNDASFSGAVRGEMILTRKTFEEHFQTRGYKNHRNAAVGIVKRLDGKWSQYIDVIVYDVYSPSYNFPTEIKKMEFLLRNFPQTVPSKLVDEWDDLVEFYQKISLKRPSLEVDIDGLVVKANTVDLKDAARTEPERQIALKFPLKVEITTVRRVEWSANGVTYTPVAIIDPVSIQGTTVGRASLCNPDVLRGLGLRVGSTVVISKRGEINPKIEKVLEEGDGEEIELPKECFYCPTPLKDVGGKLYCPNPDCDHLLLHQAKKWVSTMEIKKLGKGLLQTLCESEKITSLRDLYLLTVEDLQDLKGEGGKKLGKKNAQKVVQNIQATSTMPLNKFMAGFDITGVGEKVIDLLFQDGYNTLEKILELEEETMTQIKGIGPKKARIIYQGIQRWREEMIELTDYVVIYDEPPSSQQFSDTSFCFTGKLQTPRKKAEEAVKSLGGKVKSGVSAGLTYLVTNDPQSKSKKNQDARKHGTQIITEEEFWNLIQ